MKLKQLLSLALLVTFGSLMAVESTIAPEKDYKYKHLKGPRDQKPEQKPGEKGGLPENPQHKDRIKHDKNLDYAPFMHKPNMK